MVRYGSLVRAGPCWSDMDPQAKRTPSHSNFGLLIPESRKETVFLDLDLTLDLDRFPILLRPGFLGRGSAVKVLRGSIAARAATGEGAFAPRRHTRKRRGTDEDGTKTLGDLRDLRWRRPACGTTEGGPHPIGPAGGGEGSLRQSPQSYFDYAGPHYNSLPRGFRRPHRRPRVLN